MEFVFKMSAFDDPALEAETAELLRQRLEARSRQVMPLLWKLTDRLDAKKRPAPTAANRKEAAAFLDERRALDWETLRAEVRFDEDGWSAATAEGENRTAYGKLRGVFGTEYLWLLVYEKDMALLLQKKDLVSGAAEDFLPFLREKLEEKE